MRKIISYFLLIFSAWTLSSHMCVILGLSLKALLIISPILIFLLILLRNMIQKFETVIPEKEYPIYEARLNSRKLSIFLLVVSPLIMSWSWMAFWAISSLILLLCMLDCKKENIVEKEYSEIKTAKLGKLIIILISLGAICLSYAVSRSDLDDSFYVAVAAFTSSNPSSALIAVDPMLGESNFPLIFPSYRFASFELLSGAIAYLASVPAMDVYYIYLLPFWAMAVVASNYLLTQEIIPKHWLLAGTVSLLLTLLLGEMHRSPANFSFVRIFQGKAVFVSVIVPTIFYLTHRFFSRRGTNTDLLLLACCQVSSIGLTNFGMLMGPVVGFGAIISNIPLAIKYNRNKRIYYAFLVLLIPLPYLANVAMESNGSPVLDFKPESAPNAWTSVFGFNQQYLLGFLILAGPVLARDAVMKWRLAAPALMFFLIYLNPYLSDFISNNLTTPPVYWRVTWSFPFIVFAAVSLGVIMIELFGKSARKSTIILVSSVAIILIARSAPFHTLRHDNIGPPEGFAAWKVPRRHLLVSTRAMEFDNGDGRMLAPDDIAGVISRFEDHPPLVSSRGLYLDLMRPFVREDDYARRKILYEFVNGIGKPKGDDVKMAMRSLNVATIVLKFERESFVVVELLESQGFKRRQLINSYSIWTKHM